MRVVGGNAAEEIKRHFHQFGDHCFVDGQASNEHLKKRALSCQLLTRRATVSCSFCSFTVIAVYTVDFRTVLFVFCFQTLLYGNFCPLKYLYGVAQYTL